MHVDYVVSPRLIGKQYIPPGSWGTFHEDLGTRAGMNRELRTDMISRLRSGDCVRTRSVRTICDAPQELERLVREITGSHRATIEFIDESITIKPDDIDRLDLILKRLGERDPWRSDTCMFPPEVIEAAEYAAEASDRLQKRIRENALRASHERRAG